MPGDDMEAPRAQDRDNSGIQLEGGPGPVTVWRRWYGEPNVPFHRYCDLFTSASGQRAEMERHEPAIYYTRGVVRFILRRTPLFVLLAAVLLLVGAEYSPELTGLGATVSGTKLSGLMPTFLFGFLWLLVLLALVNQAGVLPGRGLLEGAVVYLTALGLLVGVLLAVFTAPSPSPGPPDAASTGELGSVVSVSGFLLMLFVGGHLVYDGMLRTENLFSRLHEKHPPVIGPSDYTSGDSDENRLQNARDAYKSTFLTDFEESLESRVEFDWLPGERSVRARTGHVFAVLFVTPFFVSGLVVRHGSFDTALASLIADPAGIVVAIIPALLDVVLVVVFFQFLVLITYFNRLLTEHSSDNDYRVGFTLQYRPRHPDSYAGFRDMGRFATRVNSLLIIGGLYVAYRIYISGLPSLPTAQASIIGPETMTWTFNYLGPLAAYLLAVVVWMYFSFWQIHKAMRRGRERTITAEMEENDGVLPEEKLDIRQAPVWPLNVRQFASLLLGDMLPLLTLLPLI